MSTAWHLLTGEYPPQPGGVSDYVAQLAGALHQAGERVEVWAPGERDEDEAREGVQVHRLRGGFGVLGLRSLARRLRARDPDRRLFLQYVPHAFGYRSMNAPLCAFLAARREPLWLMFHEVAYPWHLLQPLLHNVLAAVHRGMATALLARAERVFVSTEAWRPLLERFSPRRVDPVVLPIPSNLPVEVAPAPRATLGIPDGVPLVAHFGTYRRDTAELLEPVVLEALRFDGALRVLLLGRGARAFAARLARWDPSLPARLVVRDGGPAPELAAALAAADVALQPYGDGATTRRSSLSAALALGVPVVTNAGRSTEPLWRESGAAAFAPGPDPAWLTTTLRETLASAPARQQLAAKGRLLYATRFELERTIEALLAAARGAA